MHQVNGVRVAVATMLLAAALAGCSSGSDEPESDKPDAETSAADGAVSTEDLEDMHTALDEVGDLIDEAGDGAGDYQTLVSTARDDDPGALLDNPEIEDALTEQQELQTSRNDAVAELGEMAAMNDPAVADAYDAFADAAEKMFAFQDGYNASMPEFLHATDVCLKLFDVSVAAGPATTARAYETEWRAQHRKVAAPCQDALKPLADSGNYRIQEYADITNRVIKARTAAMTDIGSTDASLSRALDRLTKANETYVARQKKVTAFSDELARISAVDEYQALHQIFEDELGLVEGDSASPSPSDSPSGSPS